MDSSPCDALVDAAEVYSKMIACAFQTIIAADNSKFNMKFPAKFAVWKDVDFLMTDKQPKNQLNEALLQNSVAVKLPLPGMLNT